MPHNKCTHTLMSDLHTLDANYFTGTTKQLSRKLCRLSQFLHSLIWDQMKNRPNTRLQKRKRELRIKIKIKIKLNGRTMLLHDRYSITICYRLWPLYWHSPTTGQPSLVRAGDWRCQHGIVCYTININLYSMCTQEEWEIEVLLWLFDLLTMIAHDRSNNNAKNIEGASIMLLTFKNALLIKCD